MILVSQPTANQNTRAALRGLAGAGLLGGFSTTVAFNDTLCGLVPGRLATSLRRRAFPEARNVRIYQDPIPELARALISRLPQSIRHFVSAAKRGGPNIYASHDAFTARLIPRLKMVKGVYACAGGAGRTFAVARMYGMRTILEQPIAYAATHAGALASEAAAHPDWYNEWMPRSSAAIAALEAELSSADLVLTPSQFVSDSLPRRPLKAPVIVVPYGMPNAEGTLRSFDRRRALKVLFVGGLDCRKGIKYVVEAVEKLGNAADLSIIGIPPSNIRGKLAAALRRHRHIVSVPHHVVLEEMAKHDVLVLPSLAEGMALVVGEALAVGLPVVVTAECGVDAWVRDGVNGVFIPSRDADALAAALTGFIEEPSRIEEMSCAALRSVRKWGEYEREFVDQIGRVLANRP
jgi:starch synthase